ncbi:hypothetical protein G4G28_20495 [Massilia sp. Dwa41.01b]|uniref:hypothetical protein n=1 Tax=unclassified Massilia TaxID=2609279 RepID=UPI0016012D33|nr:MULTISPECIES: hypothetical protein [unclassified Massilia]QNA90285.1 hypothetical protein G4G28_20495 [Massilia sp. Dwa41.01b]QNB01186.1 hypothetical protein G4G31_24125 [Massilia sp. Se16.2.3]
MPALHVIEHEISVVRLSPDSYIHDSGDWKLSEETARKLVGGDMYLHTAQDAPSHFGGRILGYRIHEEGPLKGRVVFRIEPTMAHKGVRTGRDGWAMEMKIVL